MNEPSAGPKLYRWTGAPVIAVAALVTAAGVLGAVTGLMAFGLLADAYDEFGGAALRLFAPTVVVAAALALLPETKGRELEDWEQR